MKRRDFNRLTAIAASSLAWHPVLVRAANESIITLRAVEGRARLYGDAGGVSSLWLYNHQLPGPIIRARRGQRVRVRFINELQVPSTVHWHGIRIDNKMDGVSGLTQAPVAPGEHFDYDFVAPDAGTYWYHAHHQTWNQVPRGLAGTLIVEDDEPVVPADQDVLLALCDWSLDEEGVLKTDTFGSAHAFSHAGRLGNWLTVNGVSKPDIPMRAGHWHRLRLINMSSARILDIAPDRIGATVIALDGQSLAKPREMPGIVKLAPAQRMDLMMRPERAGVIPFEMMTGRAYEFARLVVAEAGQSAPKSDAMPVLKPNDLPEPDLSKARVIDLRMEGGAMGRRRQLTYKGEVLTGRRYVETRQFWGLNGVAGMAQEPLFRAQRGESIIIDSLNDTAFAHAMHTHGHHFQILSRNGVEVAHPDWRDTFISDRGERVKIAFVADNPGKWLIHCHMLGHAAAGLLSWFEVQA